MKIDNYEELGASRIEFDEYIRNNIIYPELSDANQRFYHIPIRISISPEGNLVYAKYEQQEKESDQSSLRNDPTAYINEALRLINSFRSWVPNKVNGAYQKTDKIVMIFFHYHSRLKVDSTVVLNPDTPPKCLDNTWRTEYTLQAKNGCDGMGQLLAIINQDGVPEDLEIYNIQGKTNRAEVEKNFLHLGKWSPALLNGERVNAQISIMVYT